MLTPRFALDLRGSYAVSRSPFLIPKIEERDTAFLKFFCAVLNSSICHWHMSTHSPKYGGGYNRVEVPILKGVPAPDPSEVQSGVLHEIVGLVDRALRNGDDNTLDLELDQLVISLYELTAEEQKLVIGQSS